ncbi:MAG: beta-lactamase family protein [Candidatus Marinimicrobia bacterium]|jgi:CubicO group peptidase (beta-lactamase class C family)|nr:beta-lactamase family protein [Candidatus Neomarinimicrobiota bacterium]MBT3501634.1 beta-lactamase family protein [Candidatus Neomarinimicrobiota bacterium]MBT3839812.1 beta-lactamase family protein [Candidatus Neomarinimicrobiota bacterium]MBT3998400.1 beta-lactamase family protein [Candidatus Neomarinimicrobiota bacterium]MBT4282280.1 beta-lactamase family protein [Candidatus Neomarinimicrobiota bacterium]
MIQPLIYGLITASFIVLASCGDRDLGSPITEIDDTFIDSLFIDYNNEDSPGAALMIIKDGKSVFSKGYGLANLEDDLHVENETNFRLASVTKQFTAMCVMILINRDELSFESSLTDIFSNFPAYGNTITIRQILNHTSGLLDYESLIPTNVIEQVTDQDVYFLMLEQNSTYFIPGTDYRYSNTGYALLAMIIENISKKSFAQFLEDNIFSTLGMNESIAYQNGISIVSDRAYGYSKNGNVYNRDDQSLTSAVLGDGGIYTSLHDMFYWDQNLYTNQLVEFELLNEAFTSGKLSNGNSTGYGFGWRIDTYLFRKRFHHTGSTRGFRNVFMKFPDQQISILILTNRNSGTPFNIAEKIADYMFDAK